MRSSQSPARRRLCAVALFSGFVACVTAPVISKGEETPKVRKREFVYKRVGDVELKLQVYDCPSVGRDRPKSAIVFFFGGGWRSGRVTQFEPHSRHLAERGMVGITVDYRVASRHQTTADKCVEDGKSAMRWVRAHEKQLGIAADRVAAGGGSAGGHIAAAVALVAGFDAPTDDRSISPVPNALVLFNPALVLAPIDGKAPFPRDRYESLVKRMGTDPKNLSPYHHLSRKLPPTIIFHGEADTTVPLPTARAFAERAQKLGADCRLVTYPGQSHGFFNYRNGNNPYYAKTVAEMDAFLEKHGFIEPRTSAKE